MRNLKPADENTIVFYDGVVDSKQVKEDDPQYLVRIASYRPGVVTAYGHYNAHFAGNTFANAVSAGHANPTKADLLGLYRYKAKPFQVLKAQLTTDEKNRLISTCQNCTINSVNTFDHVLPKEEFPEYAINPRNLFPSCGECNGYKSAVWRQNGARLFLNLFVDALPDEQYLFPDVTILGDEVKVSFTIENRNGIDPFLFELISSHFRRLHLLKRFSDNCGDIITEQINSILESKATLEKEQIRNITIGKANRDRQKFGFNYWKALVDIALISSDEFYEYAVLQ